MVISLRGRPGTLGAALVQLTTLALAGVLAFTVTRLGVVTAVEPTYDGILSAILADTPDPLWGDDAEAYPGTHALVLMAATARGDDAAQAAMIERLRAAQTPSGWGVPWELDAFGDGSVNPTSTAYAGVTALALLALDAAGVSNASDTAVARYWSSRLHMYSDQSQDDIWVPSAAAMIAAAVASYGHPEQAAVVFDRLKVQRFRWPYSELQVTPNDLQNYVYILWAGEIARDSGVDVPWTRPAALESLGRYGEVYPIDVPLTPDMKARSDSPWEVSGAGMALAFVAKYGEIGEWRARTVAALEEARFVPRYAAHALLGITLADAREEITD